MGKKGKFEFDAGNFLAYIVKKFKILIIISLVAAIITAICSMFLKDMYLSEANLVPSWQTDIARSLIDVNYAYGDFMKAGQEEEVDLLLQVLNSGDIFSRIVSKFNLVEHYKLDTASKSFKTNLYNTFNKNVKVSRTEYNTVALQVWDQEPKFAYEMAKEVIRLVDTVFNTMQRKRIAQSMVSVNEEYDNLQLKVKDLQDSLNKLGKLGVIDVSNQARELTAALYKAQLKGRTDVANTIQAKLNILGANSGRYTDFFFRIDKYNIKLADLEMKKSMAHLAQKQNISYVYVANQPTLSSYKDYPKRSIIVLLAAIAAFFTALFAFIIYDNIKRLV